jgi:hypothetical protein
VRDLSDRANNREASDDKGAFLIFLLVIFVIVPLRFGTRRSVVSNPLARRRFLRRDEAESAQQNLPIVSGDQRPAFALCFWGLDSPPTLLTKSAIAAPISSGLSSCSSFRPSEGLGHKARIDRPCLGRFLMACCACAHEPQPESTYFWSRCSSTRSPTLFR